MPKLEPKQIQKELEAGKLWPVYWIYGQERMKSRELIKRIRKSVLGDAAASSGLSAFAEEQLEGTEVSGSQVLDSVQTMSLGGGLRLVIVRDAHAIKDTEPLQALLGEGAPSPASDLSSVCIFVSKDLDGRKKFSKLLVDKCAVVACEDVPEEERDAWIGYLAKRRGVELEGAHVLRLRSLDPWTLDIVDQELEKFSLNADPEVFLGALDPNQGGEAFLDAFFSRKLEPALSGLRSFADHPDESLPLLGLIAWNARQLTLYLGDQAGGRGAPKPNPYLAEKLKRWSRVWTLSESLTLQESLAELDFGVKQTARLSLGLWSSLVMRHCLQNTEDLELSSISAR